MDIDMPIMNGIQATAKVIEYCTCNNKIKPIIVAQTAFVDLAT